MDSYVTPAEAQNYFDGRLHTDNWDTAEATDRLKSIRMATRLIDRLNFQGEMTDPMQENQFPRGGDETVPQAIKDATCELALALLGTSVDDAITQNNIIHERYASVQTSYKNDPQEGLMNGIISQTAWMLLKPFLRDPREIEIVRA